MQVNELIKSYRTANDLSQEEMGKKMNLSEQTYGRMERGETPMNDNKINAFAKIIQKTPREVREMAEKNQSFPLLQENENNTTQDSSQIGNLIINNYYGEKEVSLQIENLQNLLAEKDKLLLEKDKLLAAKDEQIATLQLLVQSLKK